MDFVIGIVPTVRMWDKRQIVLLHLYQCCCPLHAIPEQNLSNSHSVRFACCIARTKEPSKYDTIGRNLFVAWKSLRNANLVDDVEVDSLVRSRNEN